ncbi:HAD family hydrolase [Candidatus Undinarchaeota archaeon]
MTGKSDIELVVFDFDEVILDGVTTLMAARLAGKEKEAKKLIKEMIFKCSMKTPDDKLPIITAAYDKGVKLIHGVEYDKLYTNMKQAGLVKGIEVALKKLHQRGVCMILLSIDEEELVKRFLEDFDLLKYFDYVKAVATVRDGKRIGNGFADNDLISKGKGTFLKMYCAENSINLKKVVCVGDGLTDTHMFMVAQKSILVEPYSFADLFKKETLKKKLTYNIYYNMYILPGIKTCPLKIKKKEIYKIPDLI